MLSIDKCYEEKLWIVCGIIDILFDMSKNLMNCRYYFIKFLKLGI